MAEVIKLAPAVEEAFKAFPGASEGEKRICNRYYPALSKRARNEERAAAEKQIAEISATHAGVLEGIKQAHAEELKRHDERWQREEAKHGSSRWWSGAATGLMVAGALVATGLAIYTNTIIAPTFDAASRSRFDQMAVEAITQERPPTTSEPRSESAP